MPADCPEPARRMTFIFVFAAMFWALQVLSLHATSFLVVLLEILLLPSIEYQQFLAPFSHPVIFLFFGGFTMAVALQKYGLDKKLAGRLVGAFGQHPAGLILGFLVTTAFFSFWMSGTATSTMMLVLIHPLLSQTEPGDPFRKALVLAIPFGARIGGLCTPIGTPPNAITVGLLSEKGISLGFWEWMKMGAPLALVILLATMAVLYWMFPPRRREMSFSLAEEGPMDGRALAVFAIALATVLLWLSSSLHKIPEAVVALAMAALFFGSNLLDRHDLKRIDWDILILMWGGLALGEGMEQTGLTTWLVGSPWMPQDGFGLFAMLCVIAVALSTFMSNTAAANLLVPLAISLSPDQPMMLAIGVALCCSFDVPLPISSPPNALAFSTGAISVKDMLKAGAPITLVAVLLVLFALKWVLP